MDLDAAAEDLYAGSPDDFVERRTALVAEARAARDRQLAKEIAALRRPTRTAWLVNRLARENPGEVATLLALGAELADAQRRRSGDDLRRLSTERRQLVGRLARDAVRRGAAAGYAAAETALAEVSQSLQAALADPAAAELLRQGRLTAALSYGGFGPSDLLESLAASLPVPAEADPAREPEPAEPAEPETPDPARVERQQRADAAESAWQQASAALVDAESEAEAATAQADALADRIEALQAELAQAEADETAARTEARAARRREQAASRTAREAAQDREEARTALDS